SILSRSARGCARLREGRAERFDTVDEPRPRTVQEIRVDGEKVAARDGGQRRPALPLIEPRGAHGTVRAGDDGIRLGREHGFYAHAGGRQRQRRKDVLAATY